MSYQREALLALRLTTQHPPPSLSLSGSIMVSNVSFSSVVSREQTASEAIAESMKTLAASKQKYSNCRAGTTRPRIKRQYAPQLVHHCEIIVLLRSAAVQVAKQIYDIITQTKDKRALYRGHTYMLSKGPLTGLQNKKEKGNLSSVSMVTEQSRPTYSIALVSQGSFRKLSKLV